MKKPVFKPFMLGMACLLCLLLSSAVFAESYDASGTWEMQTSEPYDSCDAMVETATFDVIVEQDDDTFTVTIEDETMNGEVSGNAYSIVNSYDDDGGTTEEEINFTLTSASSGYGSVEWNWSDSTEYCYGSFDFTLTKKSSSTDDDDDDYNDDDDDEDDEEEDDDNKVECFIGAMICGSR